MLMNEASKEVADICFGPYTLSAFASSLFLPEEKDNPLCSTDALTSRAPSIGPFVTLT